jgi:hypothetical protein
MNREVHVRFYESLGARFPRATHQQETEDTRVQQCEKADLRLAITLFESSF